jgi:uncharacterized protein YeaO (DUF488 family)
MELCPRADDTQATGRREGVRPGRVYESVGEPQELRVLVDGVWPRGVKKADLALHSWRRDVAPSTELRRWYSHRPERFTEFRRRYLDQLTEPGRADAVTELAELAAQHPVVLLTASRDVQHSQAAVLAEVLAGHRG